MQLRDGNSFAGGCAVKHHAAGWVELLQEIETFDVSGEDGMAMLSRCGEDEGVVQESPTFRLCECLGSGQCAGQDCSFIPGFGVRTQGPVYRHAVDRFGYSGDSVVTVRMRRIEVTARRC